MRFQLLPCLALFAHTVLADVKVSSPAGGTTVPAGSPFVVTFIDAKAAPALSLFSTFSLDLVQGGQTMGTSQRVITSPAAGLAFPPPGMSITVTVDPALAGPLANSFFFKVTLIATDGGTMIDWSDRFSISGLTGTNPADIVTAVTALAGAVAGPAPINQMAGAAAGGAAQWSIPYNLQSGLTKWAPMQPIPPTKITAKSATPLFPTSAFTIATTWVAHPTIVTTVTQSQTFSVSSYENQASPAAQPSGAMAKYLKRWQDESS